MVESVDTPDLKSVGHCARGSSSLPTRTFHPIHMKKLLLCLGTFTLLPSIVLANEAKIKGYKTYDSLGCMILQECKDNVRQIRSISDIQRNYPKSNYDHIASEFNSMLLSLDKVGVMVFLADDKYFPPGHRGAYHTVSNNFYLNDSYMDKAYTLMSVMRHEGWHAAQDCMAGSIKNSMIAIIKPEEDIPKVWRKLVEDIYPPSAVPWEAEATWAGKTEGVTAAALESCRKGTMWKDYPPTPLTRKWLEEEGFIK